MATTPSGLTKEEAEKLSSQVRYKIPSTGGLFKVKGDGDVWKIGYMGEDDVPHWLVKEPEDGDYKGQTQASLRDEANREFLRGSGISINDISTINLADFNTYLASKHAGPGLDRQQAYSRAPQKSVNIKEFVKTIGGSIEEVAKVETQEVDPQTVKSKEPQEEEKLTYADLEQRGSTIYNKKTGQGYRTPAELAADLGISPHEIKWDNIQAEQIGYEDLENQNGTIVNTKTGKRYKNPAELAADLDILPHEIDWTQVSEPPATPAPDPTPFDKPTTGTGATTGAGATTAGTGGTGAGGTGADAPEDPTSPLAGVDTTGWTQDMMDLFTELNDQIEGLIAQGNMVNPEIEIDEATLAGFLKQAQTELDPHFKELTEQVRGDLQRTLEFKTIQQQEREQALGRQYEKGITSIGEQAAERGLAYSGRRQLQETEFGQEAQRALTQGRRAFGFDATTLGQQAERLAGSTALSDMNFPSLSSLPTVGARQFQFGGDDSPVYQLSGGLMGEIQKQKEVAERLRASELESTYRARRAQEYYT